MHTFFYYCSFLYYILVLWNLLLELNYAMKPEQIVRIKKILKAYPKAYKKKVFSTYFFAHAVAMILVLIGLFTSQWLIFLTYFLFGITLGIVIYKKLQLYHKVIVFLDGVICSSLVLFAIINKVHLHYSMQDILTFLF